LAGKTTLKELKNNIMMNLILGIFTLLTGGYGIATSTTDAGIFVSLVVCVAGLAYFWVGTKQMAGGEFSTRDAVSCHDCSKDKASMPLAILEIDSKTYYGSKFASLPYSFQVSVNNEPTKNIFDYGEFQRLLVPPGVITIKIIRKTFFTRTDSNSITLDALHGEVYAFDLDGLGMYPLLTSRNSTAILKDHQNIYALILTGVFASLLVLKMNGSYKKHPLSTTPNFPIPAHSNDVFQNTPNFVNAQNNSIQSGNTFMNLDPVPAGDFLSHLKALPADSSGKQ